MISVTKNQGFSRDIFYKQNYASRDYGRQLKSTKLWVFLGFSKNSFDQENQRFWYSLKIVFSPLLFQLHVTTRRYTCMKRTPICISSSVACIHMTFTLVPHKFDFTCMDFTFRYGFPHQVYFSCMASTSSYNPCTTPTVVSTQPGVRDRPVQKTF